MNRILKSKFQYHQINKAIPNSPKKITHFAYMNMYEVCIHKERENFYMCMFENGVNGYLYQ